MHRWCSPRFLVSLNVLTAIHCNMLQHAATRCNTLQHAATYRWCSLRFLASLHVLTATHYNINHCTPTHLWCSSRLQRAHCNTATHCNTLQNIGGMARDSSCRSTHCPQQIAHYYILLHITTYRWCSSRFVVSLDMLAATPHTTLQHPATHCGTLQQSATVCNTLQHTGGAAQDAWYRSTC